MSSVNAPSSRYNSAAVYTGTEMILWGGVDSSYNDYTGNIYSQFLANDGAKYNPTTNSWTTISTTGAPTARYSSSAAWTGTYMVVWGGYGQSNVIEDGARYNPSSNTWSAIPTSTPAPGAGDQTKSFWTGTYVLVLGNLDSIGRYNPNTNTWIASANFPGGINYDKNATVWTGTELLVFMRFSNQIYKYNPSTNTWTGPISITGTYFPDPNFFLESAVWTDTEMILYGEIYDYALSKTSTNLYYRYNPVSNSFVTTNSEYIQSNRLMDGGSIFLRAGSVLFLWGGYTYVVDPSGDYNLMSSKGTRIYLSSGISIPTVYIEFKSSSKLFLYQKN
jgi:hypothetical protein